MPLVSLSHTCTGVILIFGSIAVAELPPGDCPGSSATGGGGPVMSHRRQTPWQLWFHLADKFIWLIGLGSCYQIFWWESIIFGFITKGKSHGEVDDQRGITRGKKNRADVACFSAREFSFSLYRRMYELLEFPLSKICPVWIFFFIFHFFWMNRIFHIASATCKRCVLASFWFCPRDTKRARTLHTWASLGKAASSSFRPATGWCLNNYDDEDGTHRSQSSKFPSFPFSKESPSFLISKPRCYFFSFVKWETLLYSLGTAKPFACRHPGSEIKNMERRLRDSK